MDNLRGPTPPSATFAPGTHSGKGSVALRAMRSVRSLARIGSWAQLKNIPNPDSVTAAAAPIKDKESDGKKKKKKKEKEKEKAKETIRYSGSSFEAGTLSASPVDSKHGLKSLGKKRASILRLGLPSTTPFLSQWIDSVVDRRGRRYKPSFVCRLREYVGWWYTCTGTARFDNVYGVFAPSDVD